MELEIAGRRALVTGASGDIGRAICLALAREGVIVAAVGRRRDRLDGTVSAIEQVGGRAVALDHDLGDPARCDALLDNARMALGGPVTIAVIGHATYGSMGKIHGLLPQETRATIATDVESTVALLGELVVDMMRERFGRIVFVSSLSAQLGQGAAPIYCAVKASIEGLSRNIAIDFAPYGVTSNVVAPGFVDTERFRKRTTESGREDLKKKTPSGEIASASDVASVTTFLCGARAGLVNGSTIEVAGGMHLAPQW